MLIDEIPPDWRDALSDFIENRGGRAILDRLNTLLQEDAGNYSPEREQIFAAFEATSFDSVRVVIIGQNPYAEQLDATGLAFATNRETTPSLDNIYEAIRSNNFVGERPANSNLDDWARQENILLLNRVLTFNKDDTDKHKDEGWEQFIQAVIDALVDSERHIHFMLWGKKAQKFRVRNCPECRLHKTNLPAQQRQDYVQVFLDSRQFLDVNTEIRDSPRNEEEINWFPPE